MTTNLSVQDLIDLVEDADTELRIMSQKQVTRAQEDGALLHELSADDLSKYSIGVTSAVEAKHAQSTILIMHRTN